MQKQVSRVVTLPEIRHRLFNEFGGRVLDVGCGTATESIRLALDNGCEVYGVDNKQESLTQARKTAQESKVENKVEFILADANEISFRPSYFDIIMFKSSLHHLVTWKEVLSKAKEWLKTGGILYLEEPLKTNPIASLGVRMYYSIASPLLNIHEKPDPNQWPFDPRELIKEVEQRFDIEHISYHGFISTLLSKVANYAKNPFFSILFQGLSNATIGLDMFVQFSPRLQRYCSLIVIKARKNN